MAEQTVTVNKTAVSRFIDRIGALFQKAVPVLKGAEAIAVAAEPVLALTPAGPEYQVAVNAIVGAQQVAAASLAAGTDLTGEQKAQIAVQAATPALMGLLTSKGVTTGMEDVIRVWIQNVFNILAGPVMGVLEAKTEITSVK